MKQLTATRHYHFESAHFLPRVPDGHKCKNMHGHNYKLEVTITGPREKWVDDVGFIMDFWDMDKVVDPIIKEVDHKVLNDIVGLTNPTAENITSWFFDRIQQELPAPISLVATTIWETHQCCATLQAGVARTEN